MNKIKEKILNLFNILKKSMEKFPITIFFIVAYTVFLSINLDNDLVSEKTLLNMTIFTFIFTAGNFLIETLIDKKNKKKIMYLILSAIWAGLITYASNIKGNVLGMTNDIFMFRVGRIAVCYLITVAVLAIYYSYKKSNKNFEEFVTQTFIGMFKTSLIYGILAIGLAIITSIFIYLILNGGSYTLVARMEILLLGIYYIPTMLYCFNEQEEIGKFAKMVIKYVLGTLVMIAYVIIYMYIVKILILRDMPSNQVFRILSALFIAGLPIWTMIMSFKDESTFDKINNKLPLLFIPFILLQGYCIAIRINANGITEARYLCLILMIFEIIYIAMYLKNKENISKALFVLVVLTIISGIVPYINMFYISDLSQYNNLKVYKQKSDYTDEEKQKIKGAYNYLKYSVEGKKYVENFFSKEDIEKISEFQGTKYNFNLTEYLYAGNDLEYIDVAGYKKLYKIRGYESNSKKYKSLEDSFTNVKFTIENRNNDYVYVNLYEVILNYIKNKEDINEYFSEKHEVIIDDNRKIILENMYLEYIQETSEVVYFSFGGYLLER